MLTFKLQSLNYHLNSSHFADKILENKENAPKYHTAINFLPTSLSELLKTFESVLEFEKQIAPNNLKTRKLEHKQPLRFYTRRGFILLLQALPSGFPSLDIDSLASGVTVPASTPEDLYSPFDPS